jgi:hypothetical protein
MDVSSGRFRPWPGSVDLPETGGYLWFRLILHGGQTRGVIRSVVLTQYRTTRKEWFASQAIASGGTRLPLRQTYTAINTVTVTLNQDAGSAVLAKLMDKNASLGPLIQCFDASGISVSGTVDAEVRGY